MAENQNQQNTTTPKKTNTRGRTTNDLEMLKVILDSDPVLKRKVIRFMQKNYSKAIGQNNNK